MSNLPHFVQDQRENVVWKHLAHHRHNWLEKRIRSLLKNESLAVRYTYGYLRYVDKDNRGFAYPAQATIARAVKVSSRHVIRCLARLEELDLIIRGKKAGHSYYIFTLPSSLKEIKSPLEANLEEITQEVKALKEKALRHHWREGESHKKVTQECHTNKTKIKNKIRVEATSTASKTALKNERKNPLSPSFSLKAKKEEEIKKVKEEDWFDWIEGKKVISLNEKEEEEIKATENLLLKKRRKRFKDLPESFLTSYVQELALTHVLQKHRNLTYTGAKCLLLEEIDL